MVKGQVEQDIGEIVTELWNEGKEAAGNARINKQTKEMNLEVKPNDYKTIFEKETKE